MRARPRAPSAMAFPYRYRILALLFAASLVVIYGGPSSPFLYFQF